MVNSDDLTHGYWRATGQVVTHAHVYAALGTVLVVVFSFSVIGNTIVVYCYRSCRSLRNTSNMFIVNLAVADLLMSVVDFPMFIIASFLNDWPFGHFMCQVYGCITGLAGLVTINTLVVIAIDRYNAVVRRVNNIFDISNVKVAFALFCIWSYAFVFAAGPVYGWSAYRLEGVKTTCSFDFLSRDPYTRSFIITIIACEFVVPMILIILSYSKIISEVFHRRRELFSIPQSTRNETLKCRKQKLRIKSEVRTSLIVFGLIILFSLSWTPYTIVALIGQFGDRKLLNPYVTIIPSIIAKLSTVSNPVVYAISHPKFKAKIVRMFRKAFRCRNPFISLYSSSFSEDSISNV